MSKPTTTHPQANLGRRGLLGGVAAVAGAGALSMINNSEAHAATTAKVINVRDLGAKGDGSTDDSAAFKSAMAQAVDAKVGLQGIVDDYHGQVSIIVPPGVYRLTQSDSFVNNTGLSTHLRGLSFVGSGIGVSTILFDPGSASELCINSYLQDVSVTGFSFALKPSGKNSVFWKAYNHNISAAQSQRFVDVEWNGPWKYLFQLSGDDNNSEWHFRDIATSGMADGGAIVKIGDDGSAQFCNFWFDNVKHWTTNAKVVEFSQGGQFHFRNIDVSNWGNGDGSSTQTPLTTKTYLFDQQNQYMNDGMSSMSIDNLRVEAKNSNCGLLRANWASGNITIKADWSSQSSTITYGDIIDISTVGALSGTKVVIHDSYLAGGIKIHYSPNSFQSEPVVVVRDTVWRQRLTSSEVVSYDRPATTDGSYIINPTDPIVEFIRCRGDDHTDSLDKSGWSVWDASIGANSRRTHLSRQNRSVEVREVQTQPNATHSPLYINLPVGAIIKSLTATSALVFGGVQGAGKWTVTASDGTLVGTVEMTTTGQWEVTNTLTKPFVCNTRARASLVCTPTGPAIGSTDRPSLLVNGWW